MMNNIRNNAANFLNKEFTEYPDKVNHDPLTKCNSIEPIPKGQVKKVIYIENLEELAELLISNIKKIESNKSKEIQTSSLFDVRFSSQDEVEDSKARKMIVEAIKAIKDEGKVTETSDDCQLW